MEGACRRARSRGRGVRYVFTYGRGAVRHAHGRRVECACVTDQLLGEQMAAWRRGGSGRGSVWGMRGERYGLFHEKEM